MTPIILSGGSGSRLWPLSRKLYPKQFLALTGERTLFQQTLQRLSIEGMQPPVLVANQEHRFIVLEQLEQIGQQSQMLLLEPFGRNTAPAVAMAALQLVAEGRDELMLVLPADHVLDDQQAFRQALALATVAAEKGEMVLFGVPADRPETGYGYIRGQADGTLPDGVARVANFVEKPDAQRATEYVASGDYYWNSGMFLFRASRFLEELKHHDVDIYDTCLLALERSKRDGTQIAIDPATFACCPDNSIDYAVMEKTTRACVVPLAAGWNDVGSWSSIWEVHDKDAAGNVTKGDVVVEDSRNCLIHGNGKLVSVLGLDDIVVVETKDAMMVAHKDRVQDVKKLVSRLDEQGRCETQNHCEVYRPWGSYDSVDMGGRFQVKHITVKPGAQLSLQMHHHRAEHWIVVSGTAKVTCDDREFLLTENQSTYIPMTSVHRLSNPGKIPLEIIEVQSGTYLGEDDIERLEDVYGRSDAVAAGATH
ncbi:mannose-1-phosphate guanylyltransferase/mannose-6-phosphate isomerase [Ectopseudomonas hydrolytica]|jgi:mannose-1-phosphate guanylyltransferase/mannose-6-phosphate isomerase|uniref:Alginate biosynthesis protein AlgA n=2 Tax=Ectopseudomonas TaxID=3236654 RepID=A4XR22_ECTM1|nr:MULTISPECIES: mannose-1-phosphate guanylyltransferase/mannose-6-phosphate isomerase [Pseudomonas]ARS47810.1 mannose-1-phosphate guanyltransferase [Pseudomonas mendocina]EJO94258.1 mannose-1-phosphate guanylyltransferase [Pseudomonas mendocina DLHK]ATH83462.1 mannose-1-phosphate guanylyltransferase/mannose-6-phosphate isomerase [Pseudomonas mendocina]MDH0099485.1 mannose-1-phosphate guanylyltransferase/mannose-6-phosphate isomerase [Pseudomonas sp. GD04158]USR40829.1 mannose-1-phosphate guan